MKEKNAGKPVKLAPNYLDTVFIRDPGKHWEKGKKGRAVVDIEHKGFYAGIAQKIFRKPRISHIELDPYGTVVWENLDGKRTAGEIVKIMEETFPYEKERMLDRTVVFLGTLQRNGFIIKT